MLRNSITDNDRRYIPLTVRSVNTYIGRYLLNNTLYTLVSAKRSLFL